MFATGAVLEGWGVTPSIGGVDRVCGAGFGAYAGIVRGRTIAIWHMSGVCGWVCVSRLYCVAVVIGGRCGAILGGGRRDAGVGVWGITNKKTP